jgi:molecular chaperone GrpE
VTEFERDPNVEEGIRVTDKRRIDPQTGERREGRRGRPRTRPRCPRLRSGRCTFANARVEELTSDLQRVSAEYANYRKRVDRDRDMVNDLAVAAVITELLPILDDLGRAREHGEYEGAVKSVGDALEAVTSKFGLEAFGAVGEPFDPTMHEAMTHSEGDLEVAQISMVFALGYRLRSRVLRPARVGVEG